MTSKCFAAETIRCTERLLNANRFFCQLHTMHSDRGSLLILAVSEGASNGVRGHSCFGVCVSIFQKFFCFFSG